MSLETALYSHLSGDAALSALVGTRIYPVILPQQPVLPAVTYQRIGAVREQTIARNVPGTMPRYQFSVWTQELDGGSQAGYLRGVAIRQALRNALLAFAPVSPQVHEVAFATELDIEDDETSTRTWQLTQDVVFVVIGDA